jgi:hypothetical protein
MPNLFSARIGSTLARAVLSLLLMASAPFAVAQVSESEPNDSNATANTLPLATDLTGRLLTAADNDFFNISLPAAGNLTVSLRAQDISPNHAGRWLVTLQRADTGVDLWEFLASPRDNGLAAPLSNLGLPAGAYRLRIRAESNCCSNPTNVPYVLRATLDSSRVFEREVNDSLNTATPLDAGGVVGQLGGSGDNDYYSFATAAAGNVIVTLRAQDPSPSHAGRWLVTLTNAANVELWSYLVSPREAGSELRVGAPAGEFRLRVQAESVCCASPTSVPYVIRASLAAGNTFEQEPNGTAATATAIALNTDYTGELQSSSDVDLYRVTIGQAGNLAITVRAPSATADAANWAVTLQTAAGTTIDTWAAPTNTVAGATVFTGLAAGDYLVRLSRESCCSQPTAIPYQLRVVLTPGNFEREGNNTSASASPLPMSTDVQGQLAATDDNDFFKITVSQPTSVVLTLRPREAAGSAGTATWQADTSNAQGAIGSISTTNAALVGRSAVYQLAAGDTFVRVFRDCCGNPTRVPYVLSVRLATDDADSDGIPNSVEVTEGRNPAAKDNDIFASSRLFVMQMYRDFLTREGDAGGVTFWVGRIDRRERSRAQMAEEYVNSLEFQGRIAPVVRTSFAIDRSIPAFDLTFLRVAQRDGGRSIEQIGQEIYAASPRAAAYNALAEGTFVAGIYSDLLGRAPSAAESAAATQSIAQVGRGGFIARVANTDEYARRGYNQVYVTMMYMGMLRRAPEQGGFDFWVGVMNGGQSGLGLVQAFLDAPEYRGRFLP